MTSASSARKLRILFLQQGRANKDAALGHVRVTHALEVGLDGLANQVEAVHDQLPAWTWFQGQLLRWIPPLEMWNFLALRWHLLRGLLARRRIKKHLAENPPDVVHTTTGSIAFLLPSLRRRVPYVISTDTLVIDWANQVNGMRPGARPPLPLRSVRPFERRALERAQLCIAWTSTVADSIKALAPGAPVVTLHPGLDLTAFPARPRKESHGPTRILFVGGRWKAKGGPELLAAVEPLLGDSVALDVVTPEPLEPRPGLRVHKGESGDPNVVELFGEADIFCLPTTVDACPWVVVEAMASSVPVVATDTASIPEMIGEGGIVVRQRDPTALRVVLEDLIADPALRERLGAAGRLRAERFYDARKNTPQLISLLRTVAVEHSAGGGRS